MAMRRAVSGRGEWRAPAPCDQAIAYDRRVRALPDKAGAIPNKADAIPNKTGAALVSRLPVDVRLGALQQHARDALEVVRDAQHQRRPLVVGALPVDVRFGGQQRAHRLLVALLARHHQRRHAIRLRQVDRRLPQQQAAQRLKVAEGGGL
eukprot:879911-Prymnesium_polylepis.1